jgi:SAM-dependent methyltransferase
MLDLGAGNGISSYAFASAGWQVEAVEPDPSPLVGAGAIRELALQTALPIRVHEEAGERLPFADAVISAVHARQVLHHLADLRGGLAEVRRVLVPNGLALCTREHVVDDEAQLSKFLDDHPLHSRYGGESAYPLEEYLQTAERSGLIVEKIWGPLASPINAYPLEEWRRLLKWGPQVAITFARSALARHESMAWKSVSQRAALFQRNAGRLYTFLLRKA